jgi:hypothetical protein
MDPAAQKLIEQTLQAVNKDIQSLYSQLGVASESEGAVAEGEDIAEGEGIHVRQAPGSEASIEQHESTQAVRQAALAKADAAFGVQDGPDADTPRYAERSGLLA